MSHRKKEFLWLGSAFCYCSNQILIQPLLKLVINCGSNIFYWCHNFTNDMQLCLLEGRHGACLRARPSARGQHTLTWRVLSAELLIRRPRRGTLPHHSGFHGILSASVFLKISCSPIWSPYRFSRWESTASVFLALPRCWHFALVVPFSPQDRHGLPAHLLCGVCSVNLHALVSWVSKIKMQIRFLAAL